MSYLTEKLSKLRSFERQ